MTTIFNATNLTSGTTYQSLNASGTGYLRATLPLLSGLNVSCLIQLAAGGQISLMGTFSNTQNTLSIPEQFNGSLVRFQFIPNLDISSLSVDFEELYSYSFNRTPNVTVGGINYDAEFNQLQASIDNYGQQINQSQVTADATLSVIGDLQASTNNLVSQVGNIPRTNYSPNFSAVGYQLSAIENIANATESAVGSLPNASYNAQLNRIEANGANAIAQLGNLQSKISAINNNLGQSAYVSLNATQAIALYNANNPSADLIWLLGSGESNGFINPFTAGKISGSSSSGNSIAKIFGKVNGGNFQGANTANGSITIDFLSTRLLTLTGIGASSFAGQYPLQWVISGSNNGTSFTTIYTWNNPGFTTDYQFKFATFTNTTGYRYIKITQPGLNAAGNYYLTVGNLDLYGTLTNP